MAKKTNTIKHGQLRGLREFSVNALQQQSEEAEVAVSFPTKKVPIIFSKPVKPENCKGGEIDSCQNYSWCARCIDASRAITGPREKTVIGSQEFLDIPKYNKSQAQLFAN